MSLFPSASCFAKSASIALVLASWGAPVAASGWSPLGAYAPNAAGLGMAYAGSTAIADDPSAVASNPAAMTQLTGTQWSLGGQQVSMRFQPDIAGVSSANTTNPMNLPYFYASRAMSSQWSLGLAVNSPYAVDSEYANTWPGAASATRTRLISRNINTAVAYKVSDALSLGAGVNYQSVDLQWDNTGTQYRGDGSGTGWNVGALFNLASYMRLGVAYRSSIRHKLEGAAEQLTTPDNLTFSVWQRYSDQWQAGGEMAYTRWSQVGQLGTLQTNLALRDSWRFAWGAAYQHNDRWMSRFGVAVERSPYQDDTRSVRWPDQHAVWLTLGARYQLSSVGAVDAGFAYRLPSRAAVSQPSVSGDYRVGGEVLSVQYSHRY